MPVPQRLTLVTLGVADMDRARVFYVDGLGWRPSAASNAQVVFFDMGGVVFGLHPRDMLAEDAGLPPEKTDAFSGVTVAINMDSEAEVDSALAAAVAAGGSLIKPAERKHWGGYGGYVADPDGHAWEIAYNPYAPLDADGRMTLPPPAS
ncbi:MAG: VOC family protein [Azospirillaceae bacterium]